MDKIKKKGKKYQVQQYDEFFSNGKIELGRIGNFISFRNKYSQEDIDERTHRMAGDYEKAKSDIDDLVIKIRANLEKCDPLMTLQAATDFSMMQLVRVVSESQLSAEQSNNLRLIEYVQSIFVSQNSSVCVMSEENQTDIIFSVFADIEELYDKCQWFMLFWAAKAQEEKAYSLEEIEYIVEAQLMSNVRGKRYQFQQLKDFEKLLSPHSDKLEEIYGITAEKLVAGLQRLEYSLSSAKLDSFNDIMKIYETFQKRAKGLPLKDVEKEMERIRTEENIRGLFSKSFGTDLYNVKKVTGWPDSLIDSLSWGINENHDFVDDKQFSGWPIQDLPVQKKPFIIINGIGYCFDYYNLFDNIYRVIQRNIREHDDAYVNEWSKRQQAASEQLVAEKFKKILPSAEVFVGNYYPRNQSLKRMDENDLLVVYDDAVIIVEVKAGAFTYTPVITDYAAHRRSFQALIEKASFQCIRTLDYIKSHFNPEFYFEDKRQKMTLDSDYIKKYYTICVTVDNFNVFEAKIEKNKFFNMSSGTIAVSLDDIDAYEEYFDSALCFMHYLKHRQAATRVSRLMLNDELDHLGLYISQNIYEDYVKDFTDYNSFTTVGFREDIDAYFAGLYNKRLKIEKPKQIIPEYVGKILRFIENNKIPGRLKFAEFLLDMCFESREHFDEGIRNKIKREEELGYVSPFWVEGDFAYCCFVNIPSAKKFAEKLKRKYTYANMKDRHWERCWEISIDLDANNQIQYVEFIELQCAGYMNDGFTEVDISEYLACIKENRRQQGIIVPPAHKKKIYPNDSCPCGSEKKYKKCCGKR